MEADAVVGAEGNTAERKMVERGGSTGVEEQGTSARVVQEPGRPHRLRESGTSERARSERGRKDGEASEHLIVPMKPENPLLGDPVEGRGCRHGEPWRER